jgi:hypothetical protein
MILIFRALLIASLFAFYLPVKAQPIYQRQQLLWKIAVEEEGRIKVINNSNWKDVSFSSQRSNISYRFIKETNYFEIWLSSNGNADLTVSYNGEQMFFPDIRTATMGSYKIVILGREDQYDPGIGYDLNQRRGKSSRAFFDDPSEHIVVNTYRSKDVVSICPRNILVKQDGGKVTPINNEGMISIIRYDTGSKMFYCSVDDFYSTSLDTVEVPADLKPRAQLLLKIKLHPAELCDDTAQLRIWMKLPLYASSLSSYYQLSIDGKPVNGGLRIPHNFIYIKEDLPGSWVHVKKGK